MLRVDRLSGFGGQANSGITITTGRRRTQIPQLHGGPRSAWATQVLCAFACHGTAGSVPWTWGTGSVGGEAFTYVKTGTRKMPGTVSLSRAALLSRALTTSLGGTQTVSISR